MVISSIDLKDGKVVQLRQGKDTVLERDDPEALIREFNRYGETAVIDLDGALSSPEDGAEKIIVSSAAFTSQAGDGSMRYGLNEPFLESLAAAVGKERIIVSVDARGGRIALHGWKTDSGLDIDALRIVAEGVNKLKTPETSCIVITHYQRLLDYIKPDIVHVLYKGRIVKTAGPELALELEEKGYDWIKKELGE